MVDGDGVGSISQRGKILSIAPWFRVTSRPVTNNIVARACHVQNGFHEYANKHAVMPHELLNFGAVMGVMDRPDSHYECYELEIRENTSGKVYRDGVPFMASV
jgi:hypothetical protein